ncbi:hypothetical protein DPMD02_60 [Desulfofustis phage LS06-2018-MD02]|jgi:hypothetical protein|nr:hypothetical protein DPMD02_60 [Desulfofustis phage LS06-2018-MD02]
MTVRYYHFYTIPTKPGEKARRRNVEPVKSARESREVRDYWNRMNLPTAVYINQRPTAPDELPLGERLWK